MLDCKYLSSLKDDMRKHAIYLLEDLSDRDFECFLFVDPPNKNDRDPFLKELFNVINRGKKRKKFADKNHKEELMKWIGTKNENDTDVNPYNWLKIAIERFPYRLFVLTEDDSVIKSDRVPEFLKKRICFIGDSSELKKSLKSKDYNEFIINLFCSWLRHIMLDVRKIKEADYLQIYYDTFGEGSAYTKPPTVPKKLFNDKNDGKNIIRLYINKTSASGDPNIFEYINDQSSALKPNGPNIFITHHQGIYFCNPSNPPTWGSIYEELAKNTIYSEGLSGSMSYFSQIYSAISNLGSFASQLFLVKYAENALLRVGICDERFQEWWLSRELEYRSYLYQARIIPVYMDNEKLYDQKAYPAGNGFYGVIKSKENEDNCLSVLWPANAKHLWPDEKGIDMLTIHQGILEQWSGGDKSTGTITRKILKLKEKIPFINVTSGRGRPDNVPYGIKFLPFSNLESCMIGNYFERLTLLRQLMKISENI